MTSDDSALTDEQVAELKTAITESLATAALNALAGVSAALFGVALVEHPRFPIEYGPVDYAVIGALLLGTGAVISWLATREHRKTMNEYAEKLNEYDE